MFHYRLAPSNNRPRMFIAVLLAIALHMGFMSFEFEPKTISVPSVALPHSVSVFLRQSNIRQTPDQQVNKMQTVSPAKEEQLRAEKVQENPALQKAPDIQKKPDILSTPPALLEKTLKQSVDIAEKSKPDLEETVPAYQAKKELKPGAGKPAKVQEIAPQTKTQALQSEEGVILPGTIQMAYPRYQLNTPPAYPGLAKKRGQEGTVTLQVLVNREGRVDDLRIDTSSNFSLLDRAAITAVRKWNFEPGRRGKTKIPMWVRVPVSFQLK